jgi:hypothetical protein
MKARHQRLIDETLAALTSGLGDLLRGVVLYGPEAHGDDYGDFERLSLMIVIADLEPPTLRLLAPGVRIWMRSGQPWPRIFSPDEIQASTDVFPLEFLDISRYHRVLQGHDPLQDLVIDESNLRLQCERELREKMMRLREAYVDCNGRDKDLRPLLVASFASFAAIFRGCLHLMGKPIPALDREVMRSIAEQLDLEWAPFDRVGQLAHTSERSRGLDPLFTSYYQQLNRAIDAVDRLVLQGDAR